MNLAARPWRFRVTDAECMFNASWQILETAAQSLILRCFNKQYKVTNDTYAYESDGAHVNLASFILDTSLVFCYGDAIDGTVYRAMQMAIYRHDLPENLFGDTADNGTRDDAAKSIIEREYWQKFGRLRTFNSPKFEQKVYRLLVEMQEKSTQNGRMLYLADKTSAVIMALYYDYIDMSPTLTLEDVGMSEIDRQAIELCDSSYTGAALASEMWTISHFKLRNFIKYDTTGFFTALIIMATLQVHHRWYHWREMDYSKKL